MPEAEDVAARYCTECGSLLIEGRCALHPSPALPRPPVERPTEPIASLPYEPGRNGESAAQGTDLAPASSSAPAPKARRRALPVWIALVVVALLVATNVITWVSLRGEIRAARDAASKDAGRITSDQQDATTQLGGRLDAVEGRASALERQVGAIQGRLDAVPDPAAVIRVAQLSVVTVFAGPAEGSGFAFGRDGDRSLLVTNFHVVAWNWDSGRPTAQIVQGDQSLRGFIVKVSRKKDLALISVPSPFAPLAANTGVEVGDPVIALGSPFGLEGTASSGIVSAVRDDEWIQFSAPISPGSSGGPLLDAQGHVIGVNSDKIVAFGAEGLSFAIPILTVCQAFDMSC